MWSNPALFQYLWDGLMVGVCLVDHEGAITHMNLSGSRLLGWGAVCPSPMAFEEVFAGAEFDGEELASGQVLLQGLKERENGLASSCPACTVAKEPSVGWN